MSRSPLAIRPFTRQFRPQCVSRTFTTAPAVRAPGSASTAPAVDAPEPKPEDLDPNTVLPEFELALMRSGKMPIGSRRRRMALRTTDNIPFEHLPYQAFQEARKILAADRESKVSRIETLTKRAEALIASDPAEIKGGQAAKDLAINNLSQRIEELKILADINDPIVKKRFEDGLGDMNKPIYRHLARNKWMSYSQRLTAQRISQFNIVPDIIPKLEPSADVQLYFRQSKVSPGDFVDSLVSEKPPRLRVQCFDKGARLVSVVVMDADVPDPESDRFAKRCHFLAANIPISPTDTSLPLSRITSAEQLAVPWLPAFAQKGSPYHRLAIFVLEHKDPLKASDSVDVARMRELYASNRDNFSLKSFRDKFDLKPFGFTMFRTLWDENTASVMERHGIPGAETELRPARVFSLKPPVKPRGWEAKRQGPKYRQLWKYTKRIRGVSNARGWTKRR